MVRTKADGGGGSRKVVAAKAPRKLSTPSRSSSSDKSSSGRKGGGGGGGQGAVSRPVPEWQKPISMFFSKAPKTSETESEDKPVTDKENSTPNVPDDVEVLSDEEEIQTTKKVLGKRRKDDFLDSDDD